MVEQPEASDPKRGDDDQHMSEEGGGRRIEGSGIVIVPARWHEIWRYSKTWFVDIPIQVVQVVTALLLLGGILLFV